MTSLAFILGVIPLAIATGAGAASQRAVGIGVLGGMLAATPFAVIFVPTFFVVVLSFFKTKQRLLGNELKEFEAEQAAKRAREARSEEHTSELQSLMRNSYAVFCLNKKKKQNRHINCD